MAYDVGVDSFHVQVSPCEHIQVLSKEIRNCFAYPIGQDFSDLKDPEWLLVVDGEVN